MRRRKKHDDEPLWSSADLVKTAAQTTAATATNLTAKPGTAAAPVTTTSGSSGMSAQTIFDMADHQQLLRFTIEKSGDQIRPTFKLVNAKTGETILDVEVVPSVYIVADGGTLTIDFDINSFGEFKSHVEIEGPPETAHDLRKCECGHRYSQHDHGASEICTAWRAGKGGDFCECTEFLLKAADRVVKPRRPKYILDREREDASEEE